MSESYPNKTDAIARHHFEGSSANTDIRTYWYENFTVPSEDCPIPENNFYLAALDALQLKGDERVLDVGMGNGRFVEALAEMLPGGEVTGVDISQDICDAVNERLIAEGITNAQTLCADMRHLPIGWDDKFQALSSNYNLYHVEGPDKALEELRRVTAPGGRIAVLTRGKFNLVKHWEHAKIVAENLDFERPQAQYANFDAEMAIGWLSRYFTVDLEHSRPQNPNQRLFREIRLPAEEWFNYAFSIRGVILSDLRASASRNLPSGVESRIRTEIESSIKPLFDAEIEQQGYMLDIAHDRLIACINDKK